ncbi:MAG TPA: RIP metalloprotease RseP [Thermodesulfobacteriota bacterium]|nr:RIP metalloprotease RseP [Thermodesulfobacteriota bacterium]
MPDLAAFAVSAASGWLYKLLLIVVVLGVLIFVHELGHFLLAKWSGVGVLRFSLGFGPVLVGRRIGETEYVISAIPLGGYVKMLGEGDSPGGGGLAEAERARSFSEQPVWKRFLIVVAGPAFNLLTALLLLVGTAIAFGAFVPTEEAVIGAVLEGRPAAEAGLRPGDRVLRIDGRPVATWQEVQQAIHGSGGRPIALTVARPGEPPRTVTVTPRQERPQTIFNEPLPGPPRYVIGIQPDVEPVPLPLGQAVLTGVRETAGLTWITVVALWKLVQGKVSAREIGGPIRIGEQTIRQAEQGLANLLRFVALLSINLGVLNLLPVPVLDGGHLLFFVIEMVARRPLSVRAREIAQQVGLSLLILLMGFALFNDLMRLF